MWNTKQVSYRSADMEALDLVLFGLIVYFALVVIPNVWDDVASHS